MIRAETDRRVLGLIGCQVLEDEVAHVLSQDEELETVLVIDSPKAKGIASKLRQSGKPKVLEVGVEELASNLPDDGASAIVWVKPIELHQSPSQLREDVVASAKQIASLCDTILIFYGICGNAFRAIDKVGDDISAPVVILRDAKGLIVDDCVGAVLGGAEEYRNFLLRDKGGYTMNTMWAANWRHFMVETQLLHEPIDPEEARLVFQCMDYKKVVMLVTGLGDNSLFHRQADEFASTFGLGNCEEHCTLSVVEASYITAKLLMEESSLKRSHPSAFEII
jgi:hypothetical protein